MIRITTLSLIFSAPDYPGAFLYQDHVRVHQIPELVSYLTVSNETGISRLILQSS